MSAKFTYIVTLEITGNDGFSSDYIAIMESDTPQDDTERLVKYAMREQGIPYGTKIDMITITTNPLIVQIKDGFSHAIN